ncbi:MAG: transporter substrate-binding domain-containing protein [Moraxella sp.]|nr:transporter substrate-binding domain-containing protein [Moraxella sp.]
MNNNDDIGIAIDKGRPELLADINAAIDALKASGEYDKIVEKHFPSVK